MGCPPSPTRDQAYLQGIERRLRYLETNLAGFREITGVCTTGGQTLVDVIGLEFDSESGTYLLTFASEPGAYYQIQQSTDAITWVAAEDLYPAAADPAIYTTWTSGVFEFDDTIWFRVRKYPRVLLPCTPPSHACPDII